jgi:hypothetical protein
MLRIQKLLVLMIVYLFSKLLHQSRKRVLLWAAENPFAHPGLPRLSSTLYGSLQDEIFEHLQRPQGRYQKRDPNEAIQSFKIVTAPPSG